MPVPNQQCCQGCGEEFDSRNAVFRHLKATNGACLNPDEYQDFQRNVLLQDRNKVLLLYGYMTVKVPTVEDSDNGTTPTPTRISNGHDAARKLLQTLEEEIAAVSQQGNDNDQPQQQQSRQEEELPLPKINRSYGNTGRNVEILQQDDSTGAITEVLATRLPSIMMTGSGVEEWLDHMNQILLHKGYSMRLLGRIDHIPARFNAEMDITQRRMEYLIPADFLFSQQPQQQTSTATYKESLESFFQSLTSFGDGNSNLSTKQPNPNQQQPSVQQYSSDQQGGTCSSPPWVSSLLPNNNHKPTFLFTLKQIMQRLTTKDTTKVIGAENNRDQNNQQTPIEDGTNVNGEEENDNDSTEMLKEPTTSNTAPRNDALGDNRKRSHDKESQTNGNFCRNQSRKTGQKKKQNKVSRRRRFHNFTPNSMAHDFFTYRRMDRMYHRATIRFPDALYNQLYDQLEQQQQQYNRNRPFLAISVSGDLFLNGQACRVMGVLIALVRGVIDDDFIECVFDEKYPHLVPTLEVPSFALYAGEAYYMNWEGKVKKILSPRKCHAFPEGWNDPKTLMRVQEWQTVMREEIAKVWLSQGVDPNDGRLLAEKKWTTDVLEPWAIRARQQLEDYRQWKRNSHGKTSSKVQSNMDVSPMANLDSIDQRVPALYETVLKCLREADASGLWPFTTPKRQMVMVTTPLNGNEEKNGNDDAPFSSLARAHMVARNNKIDHSSAYDFQEGDGGASGSFSVGYMPGLQCTQPKANKLFPELTKAAFELERALRPDREPSSTIAVNRNAQFRPHTDSGAGVGQSTSLIVAMGDFVGGELVVEGKKEDIRYRAVEFNGWKQRHWTMPFQGERFSLVWFTPKGCEGIRGIDLEID